MHNSFILQPRYPLDAGFFAGAVQGTPSRSYIFPGRLVAPAKAARGKYISGQAGGGRTAS